MSSRSPGLSRRPKHRGRKAVYSKARHLSDRQTARPVRRSGNRAANLSILVPSTQSSESWDSISVLNNLCRSGIWHHLLVVLLFCSNAPCALVIWQLWNLGHEGQRVTRKRPLRHVQCVFNEVTRFLRSRVCRVVVPSDGYSNAIQVYNIPFELAESGGTVWSTSQCSTIFPASSSRRMSMPAQSDSPGQV